MGTDNFFRRKYTLGFARGGSAGNPDVTIAVLIAVFIICLFAGFVVVELIVIPIRFMKQVIAQLDIPHEVPPDLENES